MSKRVARGRHHSRDCMRRNRHNNLSIWRKSVGEANLNGPLEQNESQIQLRNLGRNARQHCGVFHWECRWCIQSPLNQKVGSAEQMGHRSHQPRDWSILEKTADEQWTRNSSGPDPGSAIAIWWSTNLEGKNQKARHRRVRSHCGMSRLQVATQSRTTNGHKPTQIVAECDMKNASEQFRKEQKDWIEKLR